jgi:TetR/AcrR family transcriptional regulator, cholesterol catabolism regulator
MPSRKTSRAARQLAEQNRETRYDRRLGEILAHATEVFYTKGYEGASMRDLSRVSGMSLAGLYYYFESKEKLLYLIQKHTFSTITEQLQARLRDVNDPEERVRVFIHNHLEYFLANLKAMKVLSHEDEALAGPLGAEIAAMKRDYYRLILGMVEDLKREHGKGFNGEISTRVAVLSLFGMMNWIYTWHKPKRDPAPEQVSEQMADVFLRGLVGSVTGTPARASASNTGASPHSKTGRGGDPGTVEAEKPGSVGSAARRRQRSASSNT